MVAKSPNYPAVDLGTALAGLHRAYEKETRNKMSRAVLAKHMGYNSLNGRALGVIGAVRAYGLVEGSGDQLRISDDAVDALKAPVGSDARKSALERLATRPALFKELREDFPDTLPSEDNVQYSLAKKGFTGKGASKAAKSYLATMRLVSLNPDAYYPMEDNQEEPDMEQPQPQQARHLRMPAATGAYNVTGGTPARDDVSVLLKGQRLQISADVDAEGLVRLKEMLSKYEDILKLLAPPKDKSE